VSPPGLPLAKTRTKAEAAVSPPGLPLAKARTKAEAVVSPPGLPLAKTRTKAKAKTTAPPLEEWLPDIPKSGWEGGALNAGPRTGEVKNQKS